MAIAPITTPNPNTKEIPAGYKRTEVGVIPVDWETKRLGEIGTFLKGRGIKRNDVSNNKEIACIRYGELYTQYNNYISAPVSRISLHVALTAQPIKYGDLLFAGSGETADEIGKCAAYISDEKAYAGGDIIILTPVEQNPCFLGHLMNYETIVVQKARLGQGNAVVHIYSPNLSQIQINLPPLPEQNTIATVLLDVDRLIGALGKLIAKKKGIKLAAMQQLLTGKTRLPGFNGEWGVKRLGELLHYEQPTRYLVSSTEYQDDYDVPVLTAGKSFVLGRTNETDGIFTALPVIIFDDFTTATKFVDFPFKVKSSAIKILKTMNDMDNLRVVFEFIQVIKFTISNHKRYWISEYQKLKIPYPPLPEQNAIATVLSDMDAEIVGLERRRDKTEAIKRGMMQQLLTGRVQLLPPSATA